MNFNGAFECSNCPRNGDPTRGLRSCPMWWETWWINENTKMQEAFKACGYTQLPRFLFELVRASNTSAAQSADVRNDLVSRFNEVMNAQAVFHLSFPHGHHTRDIGPANNKRLHRIIEQSAGAIEDARAHYQRQSGGQRDDSSEAGSANSGSDVLRHDSGEADLGQSDPTGGGSMG